MNFEEYFKTRLDKGEYLTSNVGQRALEEGWIACKNEILKEIESRGFWSDSCDGTVVRARNLIEAIEKL